MVGSTESGAGQRPSRRFQVVLWFVLSLVPAVLLGLLVSDHWRRSEVLESGIRADARIAEEIVGKARYGMACSTVFVWSHAGRWYSDKVHRCIDGKRAGDRIAIAYAADAPQAAVIVGDPPWFKGRGDAPLILVAILVGIALAVFWPVKRKPS